MTKSTQKRFFALLVLTILSGCYAQSDPHRACLVTPRLFCDQFRSIENHISSHDLQKLKNSKESDLVEFHMTAGMYIRNVMQLWGKNEYTKFFNDQGVVEPDLMSRIVLIGIIKDLNKSPADMAAITRIEVSRLKPPPPPPPPPSVHSPD